MRGRSIEQIRRCARNSTLDNQCVMMKIELLFTRCDMESEWSGDAPDSYGLIGFIAPHTRYGLTVPVQWVLAVSPYRLYGAFSW